MEAGGGHPPWAAGWGRGSGAPPPPPPPGCVPGLLPPPPGPLLPGYWPLGPMGPPPPGLMMPGHLPWAGPPAAAMPPPGTVLGWPANGPTTQHASDPASPAAVGPPVEPEPLDSLAEEGEPTAQLPPDPWQQAVPPPPGGASSEPADQAPAPAAGQAGPSPRLPPPAPIPNAGPPSLGKRHVNDAATAARHRLTALYPKLCEAARPLALPACPPSCPPAAPWRLPPACHRQG